MFILNGTIYNYNNFIPLETSWQPKEIKYGSKIYTVLTTKINNFQLIKPFPGIIKDCEHCKCTNLENKGGYHEFEYENLFEFTNHCQNFDPNKIINITSAI
tara:strand:- start:23 stop:325 length:303 start_codon:yes stop_codon:yes gene_type:complete